MQCVYKRHRPEDFLIQVTVNEQSLFTHARASRWPRVRGTDRLLEGQRFKKKNAVWSEKKTMTPVPVNRIHPSLAWNRGSQRLPVESCIVGQFFAATAPPSRQLNFSTLSPSAPGTCLNEKTWEGICRPIRKAFLSFFLLFLSFISSFSSSFFFTHVIHTFFNLHHIT